MGAEDPSGMATFTYLATFPSTYARQNALNWAKDAMATSIQLVATNVKYGKFILTGGNSNTPVVWIVTSRSIRAVVCFI